MINTSSSTLRRAPVISWRRQSAWMRPLISIMAPLMLWELAAQLGWINKFLLPPPSAILRAIVLQSGPEGNPPYAIWLHVWSSLYRILVGVLLALVIGGSVGMLIGMTRWGRRVFQPVISALLPVPTLAWTPILLLVFGIDDRTTIAVVCIAASFQIIYNVAAGLDQLSDKVFWVAQSMGATRMQCVWRVAIPGTMPFLITGIKLGIGFAWRSLIAAEMLAASSYGLGFMIFDAAEYLSMDVIFGGIFLIGILGYTLENIILGKIEAVTTKRWSVQVER